MRSRLFRALAVIAAACSGGAQVAADLAGDRLWQMVFLLCTALTAGGAVWLTTGESKKPSPESASRCLGVTQKNRKTGLVPQARIKKHQSLGISNMLNMPNRALERQVAEMA